MSQNYEKAAIGAGAVVALGLAWLGWSKLGAVTEDFPTPPGLGNSKDVAVAGAEKIPQTISSLGVKRPWNAANVPSGAGERPVNLFTSIALYIRKEAPDKLDDIATSKPIHEPIKNEWWAKYRLDPGFADSAKRDQDGDGFTNLEEYEANTSPIDPASLPSLLPKLKFVRDESVEWFLEPGMNDGAGKFTMRYADSNKGINRTGIEPVGPGEMFFKAGPAANRFKLLTAETIQERNQATNIDVERTYLNIEDQKSNKAGKKYRIPNSIPEALKKNFYQYDRTAVMTLEAISQNGVEFKIEENTRFSLPAGGENKEYLLKSVTPNEIEVEYTPKEGPKQTRVIPKG